MAENDQFSMAFYKAIIPVRKNYSTLSMDSPYRGRITREIRTSESEWKNNNNYGKR